MTKQETYDYHNIIGYKLPNGNTVCIIAEGRLVNLASGDGHPVEIMDMNGGGKGKPGRMDRDKGSAELSGKEEADGKTNRRANANKYADIDTNG